MAGGSPSALRYMLLPSVLLTKWLLEQRKLNFSTKIISLLASQNCSRVIRHKLSCKVLSVRTIIYLMFIQMVKFKISCFSENVSCFFDVFENIVLFMCSLIYHLLDEFSSLNSPCIMGIIYTLCI